MIPRLNDVIGLPSATPVLELGCAAERRYESLFDGASHGDANAQQQLIELRVAHLNWVYADRSFNTQSS